MTALNQYAMVFFVSLAILVAGISTAPLTFDEPAYVNAARDFLAGTPSVNPEHPPLAKYFIAISIKLFGDYAFGWRFPSAIAGALLALSIFGLTLTMTGSQRTAYIAWVLIIANGFWFVMARVAMLAIFELAFEAAAVWIFMIAVQKHEDENNTALFAFSGALFGLSVASRWCGVVGLIVCLAYTVFYCRPFLKRTAATVANALLVYAITWIPLIVREHRPASYLLAANKFIFEFHHHAKGDPRIGQMWWSWIIRFQPQPSLSYLIGNPVIGILGLAAVALLLWQKKPLLPALYIAHVLQWAIAIKPLTFYYYYFEAFTWLTVALAVAMQGIEVRRVRLDVVATACALAAFANWFAT
jgi:4-amino-4-deoxy-L-arabinose transferase-like glycosyltransferase